MHASIKSSYLSYDKVYFFDPYATYYLHTRGNPDACTWKAFDANSNLNENFPFPKWIVEPTAIVHSRDLFRAQLLADDWGHMMRITRTLIGTLGYLCMRNNCVQNIVQLEKWDYYLSKDHHAMRRITPDMHRKSCKLRDQMYWWNVQNNEETMTRAMEAAAALFDTLGCP